MSEYNIQINKYDALNAGYDQLYPKPMKHANTHASGGTDPITPSVIGADSNNETDTLLAKKSNIIKKTSITLSTNWTGDASPYTQTVTISGTTANSKVDLQPDATAITQMADDGTVALYIVNNNGTLTANAVGEKPTAELTIQATITEVI